MKVISFSTPTETLSGGDTQYYLVLKSMTGSANDELRWSSDNTPRYSDGALWTGSTSDANWDHNFAIYGSDP